MQDSTRDKRIQRFYLRFRDFGDPKDSIKDSRILGEIRDSKQDSRFQLRFHRERTRFQSVTNPSVISRSAKLVRGNH